MATVLTSGQMVTVARVLVRMASQGQCTRKSSRKQILESVKWKQDVFQRKNIFFPFSLFELICSKGRDLDDP